ncbi:MAG: C40 family peptidase [Gemmatimonadaceae bacterium]
MRRLQHVHLPDVHLSRCDPLQGLRGESQRAGRRAHPAQDRLAGALSHISAVVRTAVAPLLAEPTVAATQLSQALRGHELHLIESRGTWWLARGADDYEGWIHCGYLVLAGPALPGLPARGWDADALLSLGCVVRGFAGGIHALPLGALVPSDVAVVAGEVLSLAERQREFLPGGEGIVQSARRLFSGTPYMWGGVTPWGADCSGLVQSIFSLHGVPLPRDAWQQGGAGTELEADREALRPGDLLFFSERDDRRMTHVAISAGGPDIVHLAVARGGYAAESLDSGDPVSAALKSRFLFGRRVLPDD